MTQLIHKQGDMFAWGSTVLLPVNIPWQARSQVRERTALSGAAPAAQVLTTTLVKLTGGEVTALGLEVPAGMEAWALRLVAPPANTLQWPADYPRGRVLLSDIEFYSTTDATVVISSPTFEVVVVKDVTRA
jgi:hypothetical protein